MQPSDALPPLEVHPFEPYLPEGAKVLIMGTFPPQPKRWAMDFYYPNRTNDFWPMIGLLFMGDRHALYDPAARQFDLPAIKTLLDRRGIALHDTGHAVRRLRDNASDRFLEIVEPTDIFALLDRMPLCRALATTGAKAAEIAAGQTHTAVPRMGAMVTAESPLGALEVWRMPSTSRAYPMKLEEKAGYYYAMFKHLGVL